MSGVYGPETFVFPRQERKVIDSEGQVFLDISTGSADSRYPDHVVRRKDLVLMRQPHYYTPLIIRQPG